MMEGTGEVNGNTIKCYAADGVFASVTYFLIKFEISKANNGRRVHCAQTPDR